MITKVTIKERILTVPDECETQPKSGKNSLSKEKKKSKLNKRH